MSESVRYFDVEAETERKISVSDAVNRFRNGEGHFVMIKTPSGVATKTYLRLCTLMQGRISGRRQHRIDAMMDAFLATDPFEHVEAEIDLDNARLRAEFAEEFPLLDSTAVHQRSGHTSKNVAQTAASWKRTKKIFSVPIQGREGFPAFQFDEDGKPYPLLAQVLKALPKDMTPWQIAFWLVAPKNALNGGIPIDLIRAGDERVTQAADQAYALVDG